MTKVSYQAIPPEYQTLIKQSLVVGDKFIIPHVKLKKFVSKRKLKRIMNQKTLLPIISPIWNDFSQSQKDLWNVAGLQSGLTGYKYFIKEYILRAKYGFPLLTTPSNFHQGKVGKISILENSEGILIQQDHPITYWIKSKVKNTKSQYEPVLITEFVTFPFEFWISYASNLTAKSSDYIARAGILYMSNYQGRDIEKLEYINFDLKSDWQIASINVSEIFGQFRYYKIFIELKNVYGTLVFDNVKLLHSGKNWARDSKCEDIHQDFTKKFYQVSKHWIASFISDGAVFESDYIGNSDISNSEYLSTQIFDLPYEMPYNM